MHGIVDDQYTSCLPNEMKNKMRHISISFSIHSYGCCVKLPHGIWDYLCDKYVFLKFHFEEGNTWSFFIFIIFYFRGEKIASFTCKLKLTKIYAHIVSMIPSPKNCQKFLLLFSVGRIKQILQSNWFQKWHFVTNGLLTWEGGRIIAFTLSNWQVQILKWTQLLSAF